VVPMTMPEASVTVGFEPATGAEKTRDIQEHSERSLIKHGERKGLIVKTTSVFCVSLRPSNVL
jgi:hypothetical protein